MLDNVTNRVILTSFYLYTWWFYFLEWCQHKRNWTLCIALRWTLLNTKDLLKSNTYIISWLIHEHNNGKKPKCLHISNKIHKIKSICGYINQNIPLYTQKMMVIYNQIQSPELFTIISSIQEIPITEEMNECPFFCTLVN